MKNGFDNGNNKNSLSCNCWRSEQWTQWVECVQTHTPQDDDKNKKEFRLWWQLRNGMENNKMSRLRRRMDHKICDYFFSKRKFHASHSKNFIFHKSWYVFLVFLVAFSSYLTICTKKFVVLFDDPWGRSLGICRQFWTSNSHYT